MTPEQEEMVRVWETHTAAEFATSDVDATMATMTASPYVNNIPVMTGGIGADGVADFYRRSFVTCLPPDTEATTVTRTVGVDRIVDEVAFSFTHTVEMPWILPNVPPTGKHIEIALVAVVGFEGKRICSEHIYWDQASVLVQAGLLDPKGLPVGGADTAAKAQDVHAVPSNLLITSGGS